MVYNFKVLKILCSALFSISKILMRTVSSCFYLLHSNMQFKQWARFNLIRTTLLQIETNFRTKLLYFALSKLQKYSIFIKAKNCLTSVVETILPNVITEGLRIELLNLKENLVFRKTPVENLRLVENNKNPSNVIETTSVADERRWANR